MAKKNYVIDTSVCLTDADCIFRFGNNDVFIPLKVLEEIDKSGKASEVGVRFTTNATFPLTKEWINLLKKFKHVKFIYSVNGIKSRYEYIRQNANWNDTLKNILYNLKIGSPPRGTQFILRINFEKIHPFAPGSK